MSQYTYVDEVVKSTKVIFNFITTNRPNMLEILSNNFLKSSLETLYAPKTDELRKNGNPTTTSINRDILMLPGIIYLSIYNKPIGNSKYYYDSFSIVGTIFRASCKTAFLYSANKIVEGAHIINNAASLIDYNGIFFNRSSNAIFSKQILSDPIAFSARAGNLVCEPGSVLLNIIIARDRQDEGLTNIAWYKYIVSGSKTNWLSKVILGTIARGIVPDAVGEILKYIKKSPAITIPYYFIENAKNQAIGYFFNIDAPNLNDTSWDQIGKIYHETEYKTAFLSNIALFSFEISSKLAAEIIYAYIMIPIGKTSYDLASHISKMPTALVLQIITNVYVFSSSKEIFFSYYTDCVSKLSGELGKIALENPTIIALTTAGTITLYTAATMINKNNIANYIYNKLNDYNSEQIQDYSNSIYNTVNYPKTIFLPVIESNFNSFYNNTLELIQYTKPIDIISPTYYFISDLKNQFIASFFEIAEPNLNEPIWNQIGKIYKITNNENAFLISSSLILLNGLTYVSTIASIYLMITSPIPSLLVAEFIWLTQDLPEIYNQCIGENCYLDDFLNN